MSNNIQNGLNNKTGFNYGGARRLIFVPAGDIYQTRVLSGDTVDYIQLYSGKQFHLFENLEAISYQETPSRSKNGTIYNVSLGFNAGVQTIEKNRLFDQLADTDLVAIVQDKMNRWWITGLDQPLKMSTNEQKLDDDSNGYTLKLTTQQRERSKIMSGAWVDTLNSLNFSTMLGGTSGNGSRVNVQVQSPTATNNVPTAYNFLNQVVQPPTGYVIKSTDGEIMAVAGRTVKLPPNSVSGNYHIIKDATGLASDTRPIVIDGNGHLIDGKPQYLLNTDFGAVTISFSDTQWLVTGYVN